MSMVKQHKIIGTLAPIFSLRSNHQPLQDHGTFETGLYFLDWLKKTKQNAWQILPFNETQLEKNSATKHVPSPYKGYGIGLAPKYLSSHFAKQKPDTQTKNKFISQHKNWLEDYAIFCSIRDFYGTDDWRLWEKPLRLREKGVLTEWAKKHKAEIDYYIVQQWQLHESYRQLHNKAKDLEISLIGDIPFYLSIQSPLVWANQKAFQINKNGSLSIVSGIPQTAGTYFGRQVWGHPLYNWEHKDEVMKLWKLRLWYKSLLFENIRIDHARAFFDYGAIDTNHPENDSYLDGPGGDVLEELIAFSQQNAMSVFVEDSGDGTGKLRESMHKLDIPGIKIYYFAIHPNGEDVNAKYAFIKEYPENCVAYTTTHDTLTLLGYMQLLNEEKKSKLAKAADIVFVSDEQMAETLRHKVIHSPAKIVIIPIQDWLLTTDRINVPGTEKEIGDTNWRFKLAQTIEDLPTNINS